MLEIVKNADAVCKQSKVAEKRAASILGHLKGLSGNDRNKVLNHAHRNSPESDETKLMFHLCDRKTPGELKELRAAEAAPKSVAAKAQA